MQSSGLKRRKDLRCNIIGNVLFSFLILITIVFSAALTQAAPVDMVILLDRSGSMKQTDPEGLSIAAATFVIEQTALSNEQNRIAVVPFSTKAYILGQKKPNPKTAFASNSAALIEMLVAGVSKESHFRFRESSPDNPDGFHKLLKSQLSFGNWTELGKALKLAEKIFQNGNPEAKKIIFLVSDGMPEPDITNPKRLKELSDELSAVDVKRLVRRIIRFKSRSDIGEFYRRFTDCLLKSTISDMAKEGVEIFPVAFHRKSKKPLALVSYLQEIKKATTGDEKIIIADANTLIPKLIESNFIPSGINHIVVRYIPDFIQNAPSKKEITINVPKIALQTRFFFLYKNTRSSHKPRIKIYQGNSLEADSRHPDNFSALIFSAIRKRNGGLVYNSLRLANPERAQGSFRIKITDESAGHIEGLPDTEMLIDIRANLSPEIETTPEPIRAKSPTEIRFKLFDRIKNRVVLLPIKKANIFIVGREPEDVRSFSKRITEIRYERGVAIANMRKGVSASGRYMFKVRFYFHAPGSNDILSTYFTYPIVVQSSLPLEGNVWIARKESKTEMEKGLKIVLPPIGEHFNISYKKVEARTGLNQIIGGLKAKLLPFRHNETGIELRSVNENWTKIEPSTIRGLTLGHPVPLTIKVAIPSKIPSNIPDGIYQSQLQITDGTEILAQIPVSISVFIPRFVFLKKDINKPFNPEEETQIPVLKKTVYYPGNIPHTFKIKVWSTSLSGTEANGYFWDNRGLKLPKEEGKTENVLFNLPKKTFNVPNKNKRHPGTVEAQVRLLDLSLNGQSFSNFFYITAEHHRETPVKLIARINFLPTLLLRVIYLLLFFCGVYFLYKLVNIIRNRKFLKGANVVYELTEGEPEEHEIKLKQRFIGRFRYNGQPFLSSTSNFLGTNQNSAISFEGENARYVRDDIEDDLSSPYFPQEGDEITIDRGKRRFVIRINKLPSVDEPSCTYSIQRSPLGSGKIGYFHFLLCVVFLIISIVGFINPYLILQMIRI